MNHEKLWRSLENLSRYSLSTRLLHSIYMKSLKKLTSILQQTLEFFIEARRRRVLHQNNPNFQEFKLGESLQR